MVLPVIYVDVDVTNHPQFTNAAMPPWNLRGWCPSRTSAP